jgi:hypothetical protein
VRKPKEAQVTEDKRSNWQALVEEVEISSQHLLTEISRLIAEGNVRKLVVRTDDDSVLLTIPLTAGVVAGGVLTVGAPWLAILAAVAGVVSHVKLEIVRELEAKETAPGAPKTDKAD